MANNYYRRDRRPYKPHIDDEVEAYRLSYDANETDLLYWINLEQEKTGGVYAYISDNGELILPSGYKARKGQWVVKETGLFHDFDHTSFEEIYVRMPDKAGWRSVNEYSPENGQRVLIWLLPYRAVMQAVYRDGFYMCQFNIMRKPTHWQPEPEPPEIKTIKYGDPI